MPRGPNTETTAKLALAGASKTSRHITWLGDPPCRITPYHLTCGYLVRHSSTISGTWVGLGRSLSIYSRASAQSSGPCSSNHCLSDSPRQNGMKAALLARGHLCCLSVLGKAGGMDCGASSSSCCCTGSHCRAVCPIPAIPRRVEGSTLPTPCLVAYNPAFARHGPSKLSLS